MIGYKIVSEIKPSHTTHDYEADVLILPSIMSEYLYGKIYFLLAHRADGSHLVPEKLVISEQYDSNGRLVQEDEIDIGGLLCQ